jgi:hypothetical protein
MVISIVMLVYQRVNNVSCEAAGDMKKQTKTYYGGGPGSQIQQSVELT